MVWQNLPFRYVGYLLNREPVASVNFVHLMCSLKQPLSHFDVVANIKTCKIVCTQVTTSGKFQLRPDSRNKWGDPALAAGIHRFLPLFSSPPPATYSSSRFERLLIACHPVDPENLERLEGPEEKLPPAISASTTDNLLLC